MTLLETRRNIHSFQLEVVNGLSVIDKPFDNLLWQTIAIAKTEVDRRIAGERGSPEWYAKVAIAGLVGLHLIRQLLARRGERKKTATLTPASESRAIYALFSAVDEIEVGKQELLERFQVPDITESLGKRIWFLYTEVTVEDVTSMASEILTVLAIPKEEILAEIAEIQTKLVQLQKPA